MNKSQIKELIRYNSIYQNFREKKRIKLLRDRWSQLPADQIVQEIRVIPIKRSSVNQIVEMLNKVKITIKPGNRFQSWIDVGCVLCNYDRRIGNTSPNYSMIIEKSLEDIKKEMASIDNDIARQNIAILCAVENYIDRILEQLSTYKMKE